MNNLDESLQSQVSRLLKRAQIDALEEFFLRMFSLADEKDIRENGPNPKTHMRSLHATTLTLSEILDIKTKLSREIYPHEYEQ